jgi:2'-5' RNA ligase
MRLFLALWPDDDVRARLAAAQRSWRWPPRAAVVAPERLHLTLHFLGEVDEPAAESLVARLPPWPGPFTLRLDHAALWQHGIAVLGADEVPPGLAELHAALAGTLLDLGLRVESRRLRPHVTLARHAQGAKLPAAAVRIDWPVRGYELVRSVAGPPLHYEIIARVTG